MKSLKEIYKKYARTEEHPTGSDKGTTHGYIELYEKLLAPYRNTKRAVLEIGIQYGDSLRMWREYFPNAEIIGIDSLLGTGRFPLNGGTDKIEGVTLLKMDSTFPHQIFAKFQNEMFDVVIDDGSHELKDQLVTVCSFWPKLGPGGLHVVEDITTPEGNPSPGTFRMFDCFNAEIRRFDLKQKSGRYDDAMLVLKKPGVRSRVLTPEDIGPEVLDEPCVVVSHTSLNCHPCKKIYPWLDRLSIRLGDKAKVVLVTAQKDERPMRYARGVKKLRGWPSTMIYKKGKLTEHFYGFTTEAEYCSKVADLVG